MVLKQEKQKLSNLLVRECEYREYSMKPTFSRKPHQGHLQLKANKTGSIFHSYFFGRLLDRLIKQTIFEEATLLTPLPVIPTTEVVHLMQTCFYIPRLQGNLLYRTQDKVLFYVCYFGMVSLTLFYLSKNYPYLK